MNNKNKAQKNGIKCTFRRSTRTGREWKRFEMKLQWNFNIVLERS